MSGRRVRDVPERVRVLKAQQQEHRGEERMGDPGVLPVDEDVGAVAVEGGVPLMMGGRIVGAIGASGGTSQQDGQTAAAGATTVK